MKSPADICTSGIGTISHTDILKSIRELQAIKTPDQYIIIDPFGKVYVGTAQELTPVLLRDHPMFKRPIAFGPFEDMG